MSFPYEKRFILYLRNERFLEENTIADLTRDITRFFNYLKQNNPNYRDSLKVSSISSNDIKEYLNTLSITNNIKNTTYWDSDRAEKNLVVEETQGVDNLNDISKIGNNTN